MSHRALGDSPLYRPFAVLEQQNRRLQAQLEYAEINNKRLRRELDRTKAELEHVTNERDTALLRLAELGEDL